MTKNRFILFIIKRLRQKSNSASPSLDCRLLVLCWIPPGTASPPAAMEVILGSPQCGCSFSCSSGILSSVFIPWFNGVDSQPPSTGRGSCDERQTMRAWQWTGQQVPTITLIVLYTPTVVRLPLLTTKNTSCGSLCMCSVCVFGQWLWRTENQTCVVNVNSGYLRMWTCITCK